ncbi:hypothetical protein PG2022B_0269 [Bifidobacterium animalis subsp. animalis]|nr:hypothetical protein PG2022B_0269 [Bifidobacterium animalis subsp. animalis]
MPRYRPAHTRASAFAKKMRMLAHAIRLEEQPHIGAAILWWAGLIVQGVCLYICFCQDRITKVCWIDAQTGYGCYGEGPIYPQMLCISLCIGMLLWTVACPIVKSREQRRHPNRTPLPVTAQYQLESYQKKVRATIKAAKIIIMTPTLISSIFFILVTLYISLPM